MATGARFQFNRKTRQEKMENKFMLKKVFYLAIKPRGLILCFCVSFLLLLLGTLGGNKILLKQAIATDIKPDILVNLDKQLLPKKLRQKQQTSPPETIDNSIHTQISAQELEQQFNQLGILYGKRGTEEKTTYYVADFGKNRAVVGLNCTGKDDVCDMITLYKRFNVTNKPDLRKINQWNLAKGFGTAVIDEEGNPMIKCRYTLYGGVSLKSVNFFLVLSGYVLDEFAKYIEAS
jgi:Putative bacterial sensory transduction regulator